MANKTSDKVKAELKAKKPAAPTLNRKRGVSSGSALLNMALTGWPHVGYPDGAYVLVVGDSSAGKTFLGLTCMAEAAQLKRYDDYLLIHDDREGGAQMDKEKFFGAKAAERIRPPRYVEGEPHASETAEQFLDEVEDLLDAGKKFIYCMDSADVLSSEAEQKKNAKQKLARQKNRVEKGTMTDAKAQIFSRRLRTIVPRLAETGSILIILCQTREAMNTFGLGPQKTRAGGRALRFYAQLEFWLSIRGRIKRHVRGKDRKVGMLAKADLKKNRITGNEPSVIFPILRSTGIDDVGGSIDWLLDEGHWKKRKGDIVAPEFEFSGNRDELIKFIEDGGYEKDLREVVADVWNEIEEASRAERKKRYV